MCNYPNWFHDVYSLRTGKWPLTLWVSHSTMLNYRRVTIRMMTMNTLSCLFQTIHGAGIFSYIYPKKWPKCGEIFDTLSIWDDIEVSSNQLYNSSFFPKKSSWKWRKVTKHVFIKPVDIPAILDHYMEVS